ncbi:MAG: hypothetical protein A3J97_02875 [Spirochaetes bacterium RIFOXYC1_FULL_54_7]|nr:MAG: hypothetical protein A3J97_02875 [Spirochaetes bacterium RIFOXYC1_FULL_54_7]
MLLLKNLNDTLLKGLHDGILKSLLGIVCAFCIVLGASAEEAQWKTSSLDKGTISVQYRISERITDGGIKVPLIEDITTTVATVSLQSCIALMMDVRRHKDFMGDYSSEVIKVISDNAWTVYYYTKNPWPIADSDCVAVMSFSEDATQGTAIFKLTAAPDMMEDKHVGRMSFYNIEYSFKDLKDGTVKITVTGRTSPPVEAPLWLIKSAFPGIPADGIRKFVKVAKTM